MSHKVSTAALCGAVLVTGSALGLASSGTPALASPATSAISTQPGLARTAVLVDVLTPAKAPPRKLVHHKKKTHKAAPRTPRQIAKQQLAKRGWSKQFSCLDPLWEHESGWSVFADNASSGAYGIPQAEPGSQMASAGSDWQTDAATQIRWGLGYIKDRYGNPCGAWNHEEAYGWY